MNLIFTVITCIVTITIGQLANQTYIATSITNYNTTQFFHTTKVNQYPTNCQDFFCQRSQQCINQSLLCNGIADCKYQEDEPNDCHICIEHGNASILYEYFAYNNNTKSIIYKVPENNNYLYADEYSYYLGPNYTDFYNYDYRCETDKFLNLKVADCMFWTSSISTILLFITNFFFHLVENLCDVFNLAVVSC
eukprot:162694_1